MSASVFDLSKYSVRETATVTLDFAHQKSAYFSSPANDAIQLYASVDITVAPANVLLYVKATKMDRNELFVYFVVSLFDVKGKMRFIKGFDCALTGHGQFFKLPISLHQLANSAEELKPIGHDLKVVVEALILEEKASMPLLPSFLLSADLESLLQTGKFADVVFVVSGTKEFKAHKAILSARSPVLAAMFEHDCAESRQNRVEIPDIEVEVFEQLLRFLYTDQVDSLEQYAAELYIAADKYQVESLKRLCVQALIDAISADTFAKLLAFADSYDIAKLKEHCYVFFIKGWSSPPLRSNPELLGNLVVELSFLVANRAKI